jgi:hypothetical protein
MKPSSAQDSRIKKPYETPQLVVYGDIREITNAAGRMGTPDGGHGRHSRSN